MAESTRDLPRPSPFSFLAEHTSFLPPAVEPSLHHSSQAVTNASVSTCARTPSPWHLPPLSQVPRHRKSLYMASARAPQQPCPAHPLSTLIAMVGSRTPSNSHNGNSSPLIRNHKPPPHLCSPSRPHCPWLRSPTQPPTQPQVVPALFLRCLPA